MTTLLEGLNPPQKAAVGAGDGPVLVLAGPGSGKTRVLTRRIAYLVQERGIPPAGIMAVTFTNKAAGEMRARAESLLENPLRGIFLGTFHAVCARILRREGERTPFGRDYVIYDTDDQQSVITQAMGELNLDTKKYNPRRVRGKISEYKNELVGPNDVQALDYFEEVVARVYPRYQAILLDNNALDFDDLLMQMVILLRETPGLADKYQRQFEHVLVDEWQDTNTAQYELVRLLADPQRNVFVVGDEDQSIYAFRGADYRNVMRFREHYPDAQVILLEQNYRSPQPVLDAARAVIDRNPNRTPKALFTDRKEGANLTLYEAYNEDYEARWITERIEEIRQRGREYKDFAVMYRTNAQSRALEEACIREGIPYVLIGGVGFYKRREIRDLLAYLRIINNPNDRVSFARIVNVPRRGIGKKSLADFQYWAANNTNNYDDALQRLIDGENTSLSARPARLFAEFGRQLQQWREIAASGDLIGLIDRIIADTGYRMYLREISDSDDQATEREENVDELRGLLKRAQDEGVPLTEFLAEQSLVADVDSLAAGSNAVALMTLHAAKGLEFPVVFITGLEEGLLPHSRSFDEPEGMAEERRLMYVGLTRAEDELFLSYAFRRTIYGRSEASLPSRFLEDIPASLVDGMSPVTGANHDIARFRQQTTWNPSTASRNTESRLNRDLRQSKGKRGDEKPMNDKLRRKIVPFPGSQPDKPAGKFKTGMKVTHAKYGQGRVIESIGSGDEEEVTVAFRNHGIKTMLAEYIQPVD